MSFPWVEVKWGWTWTQFIKMRVKMAWKTMGVLVILQEKAQAGKLGKYIWKTEARISLLTSLNARQKSSYVRKVFVPFISTAKMFTVN